MLSLNLVPLLIDFFLFGVYELLLSFSFNCQNAQGYFLLIYVFFVLTPIINLLLFILSIQSKAIFFLKLSTSLLFDLFTSFSLFLQMLHYLPHSPVLVLERKWFWLWSALE